MDLKAYALFWLKKPFSRHSACQREESVYDIDFTALKQEGVSLIIFDVDDTLSGHDDPLPERSLELLDALSKDFDLAFLSNCNPRRRAELQELAEKRDIYLEPSAQKPSPQGFHNILTHYNTPPENAVMIGDKLSMDMWGAYQAGLPHRYLVEPYSNVFGGSKATLTARTMRGLEKLLLRR